MPRPRKQPKPAPSTALPRCAIYARVSSKEQAEEGYSLDAQLGLLRGYALAKGMEIAAEYVEAETAKRAGREQFGEMVASARKLGVTAIIVEKTDRIYRNLKDRVTIDELGVELHLVKEGTVLHRDSRSHEKFVHDIKLLVAKNYIDNLSEETRKGMTEKARQGIWPSVAPLGYRNVASGSKRTIEVDPDTGPIIRRLFEGYALREFSLKAAGKVAADLGLTAKSGKRLGSTTVHQILRNPLYAGVIRWNGEEIPGLHTPIVSKALYDKVQRVMEGRNDNRGGGNASVEFAYRGLITCGVCGCACSPYIAKGKYIYYTCTGAKGCPRKGVREEVITDQIAAHLEGLSIRPSVLDALREALRDGHATQQVEHEMRRHALETRRNKLHHDLERLYSDKVQGDVPESTYRTLRSRWETELEEVEHDLNATERAYRATWENSVAMIEAVSNSAARFKSANSEARRTMLQSMVSNCRLSAGKLDLDLRPWFKLVLEANKIEGLNPALEDQLQNWLPVLDGLRTMVA